MIPLPETTQTAVCSAPGCRVPARGGQEQSEDSGFCAVLVNDAAINADPFRGEIRTILQRAQRSSWSALGAGRRMGGGRGMQGGEEDGFHLSPAPGQDAEGVLEVWAALWLLTLATNCPIKSTA